AASKTPANLVWIVERCLAKDPEDRYASSKDLARDLASLRDHASDIAALDLPASGRGQRRVSAGVSAGGRFTARVRAVRPMAGAVLAAGAVGAALHAWLARPTLAFPTFQRLTFQRGAVSNARFTSGGETIVYAARWEGEPLRVFTTRLGSPESQPLPIE